MKKYTFTLSAMLVLFTGSVFSQYAPCPTIEQQQEAYNRSKASAIVVINTSTQQLQTYYAQLATYFQQLHKDNQQKAKDLQQIAKDAQQKAKDLQQIQTDIILADKLECLNYCDVKYDEVCKLIEILIPIMPECPAKEELKKVHTNRSGHADGTNPGGQTSNLNGFLNPGYLIITK